MVEALDGIVAGELMSEEQPEEGITYAAKISKAEARIDFNHRAPRIMRQIHGLSPSPGAWCEINGQRVKILACEAADGRQDAIPGIVLDNDLLIACAEGTAIRPIRLQRAGKGATTRDAFLRGFRIATVTRPSEETR